MILQLDPGIYVNIFEFDVHKDKQIDLFSKEYSDINYIQSFKERFGIKNLSENLMYLSSEDRKLYYFGTEISKYSQEGFVNIKVSAEEKPKLMANLLTSSIHRCVIQKGFEVIENKIEGIVVVNPKEIGITSDGKVKVLLGYKLRVIFNKNRENSSMVFSIIIDALHKFRDVENKSISGKEIFDKFGSRALREVRMIQKDFLLIDDKFKINTGVSRQRLIEDIIPFVSQLSELSLLTGGNVNIKPTPMRVLVGRDDGSLR